jgi:hypothetical protein
MRTSFTRQIRIKMSKGPDQAVDSDPDPDPDLDPTSKKSYWLWIHNDATRESKSKYCAKQHMLV